MSALSKPCNLPRFRSPEPFSRPVSGHRIPAQVQRELRTRCWHALPTSESRCEGGLRSALGDRRLCGPISSLLTLLFSTALIFVFSVSGRASEPSEHDAARLLVRMKGEASLSDNALRDVDTFLTFALANQLQEDGTPRTAPSPSLKIYARDIVYLSGSGGSTNATAVLYKHHLAFLKADADEEVKSARQFVATLHPAKQARDELVSVELAAADDGSVNVHWTYRRVLTPEPNRITTSYGGTAKFQNRTLRGMHYLVPVEFVNEWIE
jgi:hypothetical protein